MVRCCNVVHILKVNGVLFIVEILTIWEQEGVGYEPLMILSTVTPWKLNIQQRGACYFYYRFLQVWGDGISFDSKVTWLNDS